jgi:ABC-2 type transport system permease protein
MNGFTLHLGFQLRSTLRSPSQLLMSYLFPLAFYGLLGAVMPKLNPTFLPNMIPAMTIFAVMTGGLLGLPGQLVEEREAGIYRSYRVNGVPAASVIAAPAIGIVFHSMVAAALVALTAGPLFDAPVPTNWSALFLITLLGAVLFAGLGTLIGVVSSDSRATVLWSQALFLPSMLLGGLMIPYATLPEGARAFALLLPTTWLVQAEQSLAFARNAIVDWQLAIGVLGVAAVVSFLLSALCFNWDRQNVSRRLHPVFALLVMVPFVVGAVVALG